MDVLPHIRKHAFHVLLKSRPPDLLEILREGNIDAISDNPLLQARLEATAELKELDYTDIIRKIWEAPKGATFRSELIDVLASLGHREIVNILLPASFDTTYRDVGQKAKEALQNTGYSAEIEREEERLHLLDLSVEQERAILKLSSLSEDLKAVNADIHDLNAELINCRSSSVRILSQLLHSDIYLRVKGSEAALMLAVEFRTLNEIRAQIAPIEQEIRVLIRLINVQIGIANALFARIIQVENEMDECERGIQQCESDIAYYSSQIRNAENREWSARSELNSLSPPSWYGGSQNDREAYNSALRNYQYAVSRCEQEIQSAQAEASAAWSRRARAESQLSTYQSRLATLERQYHALGIELAAVESQIAGFTVRLNGLRRQLADLQEQFRACEARIDAIQESIKNFIRQTRDEQDRLTSHRRELSDHQTSLSHQITQAHNRRIRISQMIPMAKQEINTVGTRITAAKQNFEQTAFRVLHETFIADEAAVENSKTLRSNQEIADKLFWRIDWTIRNTLGSDSFRGQYGKTIAHMVTEIKRRKTV
jgi:predicted  nucleic acid-binding Zn-ribbon protein